MTTLRFHRAKTTICRAFRRDGWARITSTALDLYRANSNIIKRSGRIKFASYETRTNGYDMLNATLSYRFDLGGTRRVEFYVRGTNLLDELAFSHTSFVKDQSPLRGRSIAFGMRHSF